MPSSSCHLAALATSAWSGSILLLLIILLMTGASVVDADADFLENEKQLLREGCGKVAVVS